MALFGDLFDNKFIPAKNVPCAKDNSPRKCLLFRLPTLIICSYNSSYHKTTRSSGVSYTSKVAKPWIQGFGNGHGFHKFSGSIRKSNQKEWLFDFCGDGVSSLVKPKSSFFPQWVFNIYDGKQFLMMMPL